MDAYTKALNYAFLLLKYRPRSVGELRDRLRRKKFTHAVTDKVVIHLKELRYLDDKEFVRFFITSSVAKGWGTRRITFALARFKVPERLRTVTITEQGTYRRKLASLIARKQKAYRGKADAGWRVIKHCLSRGYEYDEIVSLIHEEAQQEG